MLSSPSGRFTSRYRTLVIVQQEVELAVARFGELRNFLPITESKSWIV